MKRLFFLFPVSAFLATILLRLQPIGGQLGHDYTHYFARLMVGRDYFLKNGWSVPHFTPYLCGGMPVYADPQAISHSLQQVLAFFLPPLLSTHLTFVVFYLLGYAGFYILSRRVFDYSSLAAHCTAFLFLLNGFTWIHLAVGHVTHYQFLLAPWVLVALFRRDGSVREKVRSSILLAAVCAYTFYSGGLHILVVFAAMSFVALPFAWYWRRDGRALFHVVGMSFLIFLFLCAGKIAAVLSFRPLFHPQTIDLTQADSLTMVLRYFWFNPFRIPAYILFGPWSFGPWEFIAFLPKITIPALAFALFYVLKRRDRIEYRVLIATILCGAYVVAVALGKGGNSALPFLSQYHNPFKILSAFIPLVVLASGFAANTLFGATWVQRTSMNWRRLVLGLVFLTLVSEYAFYTGVLKTHPGMGGAPYPPGNFSRPLPPVAFVSRRANEDVFAALNGETSLACYEPLYGYRSEQLSRSPLVEGPVTAIREGFFNLHHAGCLLYGKNLGCSAWSAISERDESTFERFRNGLAVREWVPVWQTFLDKLAFVSWIVILVFALPIRLPRLVHVRRAEREPS